MNTSSGDVAAARATGYLVGCEFSVFSARRTWCTETVASLLGGGASTRVPVSALRPSTFFLAATR